jgi:hypothetical protein
MSIACRVTALRTRVAGGAIPGTLQTKLAAALDQATTRTAEARSSCGDGNAKKARGHLKRTVKALSQYARRLGSRAARTSLDDAVRSALQQDGATILSDAKALRTAVTCPADGAP